MGANLMAGWVLVPCLVGLRSEFDSLAPGRDHVSDGALGDTAHAHSSSDHNPDETGKTPSEDADNVNEVHAIDVDVDLKRPDWSMERCVQIIVTRHRVGADDRLQNVIYNRRIWSRSWSWQARAYTGSNPHDHHAHFSARYTSAQEADTRPWGLLAAAAPAPVSSKPATGVTMSVVTGKLPDLKRGMKDKVAGYNYVWRLQLLLGIDSDGTFGAGTEVRVQSYNRDVLKRSSKVVDGPFWKRIYGLQ
ncbi:hypothetical protein ACWKSP_26605 [Micromonosporaceae bacterium Da 78-11]